MRFAKHVLVTSIILTSSHSVVAAETSSKWWPFGDHSDAAAAQPSTANPATAPAGPIATTPVAPGPIAHQAQMPTTPAENEHWMLNTHKTKVSWPKLHMPESWTAKSKATKEKKNTWVDKTPEPPKPSMTDSVKKGANSVATSTKSAWNKTVEAVTPGDKAKKTAPPSPYVAKRETSPPFWRKMLGAKEPEMQQPQTVPQWMAQRRVDP